MNYILKLVFSFHLLCTFHFLIQLHYHVNFYFLIFRFPLSFRFFFVLIIFLIFNFLIIFRSPPVLLWAPLFMPFWFVFHWNVPQHLIPHQSLADACNIQSWQDTINCLNYFLYSVMGSIDCDDLSNVSYPYQGKKM